MSTASPTRSRHSSTLLLAALANSTLCESRCPSISTSSPPDCMACQSPDPANTLTDRLNQLLSNGGSNYTLSLCPRRRYVIMRPLAFAAPYQEISTRGFVSGEERATLVVAGPVADGKGHTTAVGGTCPNCHGVRLRNVRVCSRRIASLPTKIAETRLAD